VLLSRELAEQHDTAPHDAASAPPYARAVQRTLAAARERRDRG
jgi:hypothetical protein